MHPPLGFKKDSTARSEATPYQKEVWERDGPFDGILGYSQGAAVAAALAARSALGRFPSIAFVILYAGDASMLHLEADPN